MHQDLGHEYSFQEMKKALKIFGHTRSRGETQTLKKDVSFYVYDEEKIQRKLPELQVYNIINWIDYIIINYYYDLMKVYNINIYIISNMFGRDYYH